jgi:iron complex transport system ATP-binding protein
MQHLKRIATELGKTIVIVIHDINFASVYSDHIVGMRDGDVVAQGAAPDIMQTDVLSEIYDLEIPIELVGDRRLATYYWATATK